MQVFTIYLGIPVVNTTKTSFISRFARAVNGPEFIIPDPDPNYYTGIGSDPVYPTGLLFYVSDPDPAGPGSGSDLPAQI